MFTLELYTTWPLFVHVWLKHWTVSRCEAENTRLMAPLSSVLLCPPTQTIYIYKYQTATHMHSVWVRARKHVMSVCAVRSFKSVRAAAKWGGNRIALLARRASVCASCRELNASAASLTALPSKDWRKLQQCSLLQLKKARCAKLARLLLFTYLHICVLFKATVYLLRVACGNNLATPALRFQVQKSAWAAHYIVNTRRHKVDWLTRSRVV